MINFSGKYRRVLKRHGFNLIEIVLAMAILSIGITSVIVLFPIGVKANRNAVAANNMSDVAEFVMSKIQADVNMKCKKSGFDKTKYSTKYNPSYDSVRVDLESNTNKSKRIIKIKDGMYLFRQMGKVGEGSDEGYATDFSAIVYVWEDSKASDNIMVPSVKSKAFDKLENASTSKKGKKNWDQFAKAICMEISWPADFPYASRDKAYFRFEAFNELFEPFEE